jgi:hypothetical protein
MGCDAADITLRTGTHGVSAVLLDTSDGWNGIRPPPTFQGSPNSPLLGRAGAIAPVRLAVTTAIGKGAGGERTDRNHSYRRVWEYLDCGWNLH